MKKLPDRDHGKGCQKGATLDGLGREWGSCCGFRLQVLLQVFGRRVWELEAKMFTAMVSVLD